jgi:xanthosine utilization system XapX-like protein
MEKPKYSNALGGVGIILGLYFAMKHNKGVAMTSIYALGLGAIGILIGNQISKNL